MQLIKHLLPKSLIVENVGGFDHIEKDQDRSPLMILEDELKGAGYATHHEFINLNLFHPCTRHRIIAVAVGSLCKTHLLSQEARDCFRDKDSTQSQILPLSCTLGGENVCPWPAPYFEFCGLRRISQHVAQNSPKHFLEKVAAHSEILHLEKAKYT